LYGKVKGNSLKDKGLPYLFCDVYNEIIPSLRKLERRAK